jgi:phosphatidylglycerol---prolipoprotein diacylglyceryl transferase
MLTRQPREAFRLQGVRLVREERKKSHMPDVKRKLQAWVDRICAEPVLFRYRSVIVVKFGIISSTVTLGFLCTSVLVQRAFGLPTDFTRNWIVYFLPAVLIGSIVPGKLIQVAHYVVTRPRNTAALHGVAFTFFGGMAGGLLATFLLWRNSQVPLLQVIDVALLPVPFFHGLCRLACLNYGCCYGHPLSARDRVHVTYWNEGSKAVRVAGLRGVPLCPVQLYELAGSMVNQALLVALCLIAPTHGYVSAGYFISYGVLRYLLHGHRDASRTGVRTYRLYEGALFVTQVLLGLLLFVIGARERLPMTLHFDVGGLGAVAHLLPVILGVCLMEFLVYGLHYKQLGRWF